MTRVELSVAVGFLVELRNDFTAELDVWPEIWVFRVGILLRIRLRAVQNGTGKRFGLFGPECRPRVLVRARFRKGPDLISHFNGA